VLTTGRSVAGPTVRAVLLDDFTSLLLADAVLLSEILDLVGLAGRHARAILLANLGLVVCHRLYLLLNKTSAAQQGFTAAANPMTVHLRE
jgi:hypothetical protein